MLRPRASIRELKEYQPPLSGRTGLRLDFNENTEGPSPRVLEKLRMLDAEQLARYPEREPVEQVTAEFVGIKPGELLLTNGVDEAIQLLCQTYLQGGDEALIVVPTFALYELLAASTGARVLRVEALPDFRFPTEALLGAITPATRLIAIANPNNPTGAVASAGDILRIVSAAPDAAVLVDEAYFEFYGQSLIAEIGRFPNLFIARTFSKAYGLAGLRAGLLAGPEPQMKFIRKLASAYNVNAAALACIPAALEDRGFVEQYAVDVWRGRARLEKRLNSLGIRYWPSQANFVLAHFGACAGGFVSEMAHRGILLRDRSGDPGCQGCVRITVGTPQQMDRLLTVLEDTVSMLPIGQERSLA